MSITCLRETESERTQTLKGCVKEDEPMHYPAFPHVLSVWDHSPRKASSQSRRNPSQQRTRQTELTAFCGSFPLASQTLTTLGTLRRIANWTGTAGEPPCQWFKKTWSCVVRRKLAKPFDVSTCAEEKVDPALAQRRDPGNNCPQWILRHGPGLSHILCSICLWSHADSTSGPFMCYV